MQDKQDSALLWSLSLTSDDQENPSLDPSEEHQWHHVHSDHPDCESLLSDLGIHTPVVRIMTETETRPRIVPHDGGILLILRGVNTNPGADPEDMVSLRIWIQENLVVSARKATRQLLAARDTREAILHNQGPKTLPELVLQLVERITDRISDIVLQFADEMDQLESQIQRGNTRSVQLPLAEARRQIIEIRRYVSPQREALAALNNLRSDLLAPVEFGIREQTDRTMRLVEELDLAREKSLLLQEELRNRIAETQNQRMYVLSLVTAVFLPLSFLTGVFGMNVAGLPGTEDSRAFVFLATAMTVIALAIFAWMKSQRWF
ncbi:MAG: zinc transporter ZntB [Pseudomonadota bacterium]